MPGGGWVPGAPPEPGGVRGQHRLAAHGPRLSGPSGGRRDAPD